jgi:hypothetical protein
LEYIPLTKNGGMNDCDPLAQGDILYSPTHNGASRRTVGAALVGVCVLWVVPQIPPNPICPTFHTPDKGVSKLCHELLRVRNCRRLDEVAYTPAPKKDPLSSHLTLPRTSKMGSRMRLGGVAWTVSALVAIVLTSLSCNPDATPTAKALFYIEHQQVKAPVVYSVARRAVP